VPDTMHRFMMSAFVHDIKEGNVEL
jgi:hypothetical protein